MGWVNNTNTITNKDNIKHTNINNKAELNLTIKQKTKRENENYNNE